MLFDESISFKNCLNDVEDVCQLDLYQYQNVSYSVGKYFIIGQLSLSSNIKVDSMIGSFYKRGYTFPRKICKALKIAHSIGAKCSHTKLCARESSKVVHLPTASKIYDACFSARRHLQCDFIYFRVQSRL